MLDKLKWIFYLDNTTKVFLFDELNFETDSLKESLNKLTRCFWETCQRGDSYRKIKSSSKMQSASNFRGKSTAEISGILKAHNLSLINFKDKQIDSEDYSVYLFPLVFPLWISRWVLKNIFGYATNYQKVSDNYQKNYAQFVDSKITRLNKIMDEMDCRIEDLSREALTLDRKTVSDTKSEDEIEGRRKELRGEIADFNRCVAESHKKVFDVMRDALICDRKMLPLDTACQKRIGRAIKRMNQIEFDFRNLIDHRYIHFEGRAKLVAQTTASSMLSLPLSAPPLPLTSSGITREGNSSYFATCLQIIRHIDFLKMSFDPSRNADFRNKGESESEFQARQTFQKIVGAFIDKLQSSAPSFPPVSGISSIMDEAHSQKIIADRFAQLNPSELFSALLPRVGQDVTPVRNFAGLSNVRYGIPQFVFRRRLSSGPLDLYSFYSPPSQVSKKHIEERDVITVEFQRGSASAPLTPLHPVLTWQPYGPYGSRYRLEAVTLYHEEGIFSSESYSCLLRNPTGDGFLEVHDDTMTPLAANSEELAEKLDSGLQFFYVKES